MKINVFADVDNIDYVINFDSPLNLVTYIHRIGRTGRGGKKGTSLTFLTEVCAATNFCKIFLSSFFLFCFLKCSNHAQSLTLAMYYKMSNPRKMLKYVRTMYLLCCI